jgi:hypothetical protein
MLVGPPLSGSKHRAAPPATFLEIHCCADAVCNFWPFKRLSKHCLGTPSVPPTVETEVKLELPSSELMRLNKLVPLRRMKPAKQVTQGLALLRHGRVCAAEKRRDVSGAPHRP